MIGMSRTSLHCQSVPADDNAPRLALIRLARQHRDYGYRKKAELPRIEGWKVDHKKRIEEFSAFVILSSFKLRNRAPWPSHHNKQSLFLYC